jgi:adenine C2-methylase RlmN of 23S rRNA A2503 and tRNA A37
LKVLSAKDVDMNGFQETKKIIQEYVLNAKVHIGINQEKNLSKLITTIKEL